MWRYAEKHGKRNWETGKNRNSHTSKIVCILLVCLTHWNSIKIRCCLDDRKAIWPVKKPLQLCPKVLFQKNEVLAYTGSKTLCPSQGWLVVGWWEFNVPFQHIYGYISDKTPTLGCFPLLIRKKQPNVEELHKKGQLNKFVSPTYCWVEMYAGCTACCPLVSRSNYTNGTDRQTYR